MDDVDKYQGLIVVATDGTRYYRHIWRDLTPEDRQSAIDAVIDFAGDESKVVAIRDCTRREHVSGISNCMFGEIPHRD